MIITTRRLGDNRTKASKTPPPDAMAVSFYEGYARTQAHELRGQGYQVRVHQRSIKAGGAVADVWVVVWHGTPKVREAAATYHASTPPPVQHAPALTSPEAVVAQLPDLVGLDHEEVWLVTVDAALRIIGRHRIAMGGRAECSADPAIIARRALADNASGAFLAHNHQSGDPTPSAQDRSITKAIRAALGLLRITLHDHLVVGDAGTWRQA